jgi:hypothetical protein
MSMQKQAGEPALLAFSSLKKSAEPYTAIQAACLSSYGGRKLCTPTAGLNTVQSGP